MANTWTDELKTEVIDAYVELMEAYPEEERGKHSAEVIEQIKDDQDLEFSVNSIRTVLSRAGVYIKKATATPKASAKASGKKMNKAEAHAELIASFRDLGVDVGDDAVAAIGKMTGVLATTLAELVRKIEIEG